MGLFHAIKHAFHKIGHGISHAWHEITHHPTLGLLGLSLIPGLGTAVGLGSSTILGGLASGAESAIGGLTGSLGGLLGLGSAGGSLLGGLGGLGSIGSLANIGYDLYALTSKSHMPSMPSIDFQKMPKLELNIQKPQTSNAPDIGAPAKKGVAYGMRYGYMQPKFQLPQVQTKMPQSRPPGYGREGIWDVFTTPRGREFKLAGASMGNQYTPAGYAPMIDFQSNPKTGARTQALYGFKDIKTGEEYKLPVHVTLSENGAPTVLGGTQILPPTALWRMAGISPKTAKEVSPADRGLMRVAESIREGVQGNIIQGKKFDNGITPSGMQVNPKGLLVKPINNPAKPPQAQAAQATNIFNKLAQMGKRSPGWTGISGQAMSVLGNATKTASDAFPAMPQEKAANPFAGVNRFTGITSMAKEMKTGVEQALKPEIKQAQKQKAIYDFAVKPPAEKYASLISAGASPERAFMSLSGSEQEDLFRQVINKRRGVSVLASAAKKRGMSIDALTAAIWTGSTYAKHRQPWEAGWQAVGR